MITRIVTDRVGEWFDAVTDPDMWFTTHRESFRPSGYGPMALTPEQEAMVRRLTTNPPDGQFWVVRIGEYWYKLWVVGLYDGGVYWLPRVCIGTDGPTSGMHTHEGYELREIALAVPHDAGWIQKWRILDETKTTNGSAEVSNG